MIRRHLTLLALLSSACAFPACFAQSAELNILQLSRLEYSFPESSGAAKVLATFKMLNSTPDDLCIPKDILVNELTPYVVLKDGRSGGSVPNPPMDSGKFIVKSGSSIEFSRVVAFLPFGKKARVTAELFADGCSAPRVVKFSSKALNLINP